MPMATETILLIEDERNIAELVKYNLDRRGFMLSVCPAVARDLKPLKIPTLILLDLMPRN